MELSVPHISHVEKAIRPINFQYSFLWKIYPISIEWNHPLANQKITLKWVPRRSGRWKNMFVFFAIVVSIEGREDVSLSENQESPQQVLSLLRGAHIHVETLNILINSVIQQSPNLSVHNAKCCHYVIE